MDTALLSLLPPVKRARAFYLYTEKRRFLDLYLDGGRAVLGHNPPAVLRELKNTAERSLFAPYPSYYMRRFLKALAVLFPQKVFSFPEAEVLQSERPLWRPFMESCKDAPQFYARLPHPFAPPVLVRDAKETAAEPETLSLIPPPYSSPVILAAATRALYDLISETARGRKPSTALQAVLTDQCPKWRRDGIYLYRAEPVSSEKWAELFRRFLDAGFLIPPVQQEPLILPAQISPGEEKRLADMLCK